LKLVRGPKDQLSLKFNKLTLKTSAKGRPQQLIGKIWNKYEALQFEGLRLNLQKHQIDPRGENTIKAPSTFDRKWKAQRTIN